MLSRSIIVAFPIACKIAVFYPLNVQKSFYRSAKCIKFPHLYIYKHYRCYLLAITISPQVYYCLITFIRCELEENFQFGMTVHKYS